jgi:TBC1 domain family member 5
LPENLYFRQPPIQKMLLDVLFVFCKLNPNLGYKQGMHEVLALVLWVIEQDAVEELEGAHGSENMEGDRLLRVLLDSKFVEHDAFTLFGLVMQNAKAFYESGNESIGANNHGRSPNPPQENDAPIIIRSRRIFEEYLINVDPGLALHLKAIEVAPQIFLM